MILGDQDLITRLHQYSIMRDFNEKIMHQTEQEAFLFGRYNDIKMQIDPADLLLYTDHATKLISCLVSNACKFSDKGTPITITGKAMPEHYCLTITNSGRGMTPEQIASISINRQFERNIYEQQGAGLGLVIAKQIVHLYNGTLKIESIPGKETTVTLMLRYARQHLTEQAV
jgi:signal transduction histidine kinase